MLTTLPPEQKTDILSLLPAELEQSLTGMGLARFRAKQVFLRLHRYEWESFDDFTELPKAERARLAETYALPSIEIVRRQESALDGTVKYLFRLGDGNCVESVLMKYKHGNTLCVSTQVGCKMRCAFCASGLDGFVRNLSAGEILMQAAAARRDSGERVDGIVMMGTGEPLDNFEASVDFILLAGEKNGLGIGQRHISLSTSGLVPKIRALAERKLAITLSVSLHATRDEARSALMPVNRRYPIAELVQAATEYQRVTGRRVSYEYAVMAGVNDSEREAGELAALLRGTGAHLNLIRLNEVKETRFRASAEQRLRQFVAALEARGLHVTVRRRLGADIDGACGQLRRSVQPPSGDVRRTQPETAEN